MAHIKFLRATVQAGVEVGQINHMTNGIKGKIEFDI